MSQNRTKRVPIVSGLFYPSNPDELSNIIDKYLNDIDKNDIRNKIIEQTSLNIKELKPLVIIAPHAGYMFSGKIQAYSYKVVSEYKYDSIIIIGIAHQRQFKGISVNMDSEYETPLGTVKVNFEFANELKNFDKKIITVEEAHLQEHSVEVQLPYIQKLFPSSTIVPILFGEQYYEYSELLYNALNSTVNKLSGSYLFIITTDLSHYHNYLDAKNLDETFISDLKEMEEKRLYTHVKEKKCEACCYAGVITGMMISKNMGKSRIAILEYADSGKITGDRRRVVGYLSAVLFWYNNLYFLN